MDLAAVGSGVCLVGLMSVWLLSVGCCLVWLLSGWVTVPSGYRLGSVSLCQGCVLREVSVRLLSGWATV